MLKWCQLDVIVPQFQNSTSLHIRNALVYDQKTSTMYRGDGCLLSLGGATICGWVWGWARRPIFTPILLCWGLVLLLAYMAKNLPWVVQSCGPISRGAHALPRAPSTSHLWPCTSYTRLHAKCSDTCCFLLTRTRQCCCHIPHLLQYPRDWSSCTEHKRLKIQLFHFPSLSEVF